MVFLLIKVVPEIAKLYAECNAKLPDITVMVLALSDWVQQNYLLLLGGVIGAGFGFSGIYRIEAFRQVWDPIALRIPLFGSLIRKSAIARVMRTMSTLIASGVPLLSAFDICQKLVENRAIKAPSVMRPPRSKRESVLPRDLMKGGLFPPMVTHMVNIGEMTGKLDELMGKVADIYDDEVDDAVAALTGLLQPAIIIVVGIMVAFLLMAMYLPIFLLAEKTMGDS